MKKVSGHLYKRGKFYYLAWQYGGQRFKKALKTSNKRKALKEKDMTLAPFMMESQVSVLSNLADRVGGVKAEIKRAECESAMPVTKVWEAFLKSPRRSDASDRTLKGYAAQWARFVKWIEARRKDGRLNQVTIKDAEEYARHLISEKFTPNTFNKHIVLLSSVFHILAKDAYLSLNPWTAITRKRLNTQGRREFTLDELNSLCSSSTGELRLLIALGIFCGLRLGDACLLDWSEVDLERGFIIVKPRKTRSRTGKVVSIPIHRVLQALLSETSKDARKGAVMPDLATMYRENEDGVHYRLQKHFKACSIKTKRSIEGRKRAVSEAGYHSLRHSFVSLCANSGAPLALVQGIVGHGNTAMTQKYFHVNDGAARAAIDALPDIAADASLLRQEEACTVIPQGEAPSSSKLPEPIQTSLRAILDHMTAETWEADRKHLYALLDCKRTKETNPKQDRQTTLHALRPESS